MNLHSKTSLTILSALLASVACASTPPRELLDARAAYKHAAAGESAQLNPAALHDAKVALDGAEGSYGRDADSPMTRDRAYVATRKAQLAEVLTASAVARRDEAQALAQTQADKDKDARTARGALVDARQLLATTEQKLRTSDRDLDTEKAAHADAEKRAREALDKLSVASALAVKDEPRGTVITMPSGVLFATGKADLLAGATAKLDPVAEALSHEAEHSILIEGHTDSQGSDASNMELSQRRAQTVRDYFSTRGVSGGHMVATGIGESRPIADNATAEGRANNRRVEIVIQPLEKR